MYSNAGKDENLNILCTLINNDSSITLEETLLISNWPAKPSTLGDLAIIQILNVITKKIKGFLFDENETFNLNFNKEKLDLKINKFLQQLNESNLFIRLIEYLTNPSSTKKDVSILILCTLSAYRLTLNLMMNKEFIKSILYHIIFIKNQNYNNKKEHIITSLQLLKRIYVKENRLRKYFIDEGGVEIIRQLLELPDVEIIQEVLYNLEDLIYVFLYLSKQDDEEYQSISKMMINEMVEILRNRKIKRNLIELLKRIPQQTKKYFNLENDIKRLIFVLDGTEKK